MDVWDACDPFPLVKQQLLPRMGVSHIKMTQSVCNIGNVVDSVYVPARASNGTTATITVALTLNKTANEVVVGPIANGEALQIRTMSNLGFNSSSTARLTRLQFDLQYFINVFEN